MRQQIKKFAKIEHELPEYLHDEDRMKRDISNGTLLAVTGISLFLVKKKRAILIILGALVVSAVSAIGISSFATYKSLKNEADIAQI